MELSHFLLSLTKKRPLSNVCFKKRNKHWIKVLLTTMVANYAGENISRNDDITVAATPL